MGLDLIDWIIKSLNEPGDVSRKENLLQRHRRYIWSSETFSSDNLCLFFLLVSSNIFIIVEYDKGSCVQMPSSSETMNKTIQAKIKYDPDDIKY